jgi:hypothetical protein
MSVIEESNAEILRPQLKLIAQGRSRELDVLPEVGNRDRVSRKTTFAPISSRSLFNLVRRRVLPLWLWNLGFAVYIRFPV